MFRFIGLGPIKARKSIHRWGSSGSRACRSKPWKRDAFILGCRSAPRLDRRRIPRGQPASSRARSCRTVEGVAADGARSADRLEVEGRVRIRVGSGIYVGEPAALAQPLPAAAEIEGPFELLRARIRRGRHRRTGGQVATRWEHRAHRRFAAAMATVQHPGEASMIHDRAFLIAVAGCLQCAVLVRVVGELFDQRLNPYFAKLAHISRTRNPGMRRWPSTGRSAMPLPRMIPTRRA